MKSFLCVSILALAPMAFGQTAKQPCIVWHGAVQEQVPCPETASTDEKKPVDPRLVEKQRQELEQLRKKQAEQTMEATRKTQKQLVDQATPSPQFEVQRRPQAPTVVLPAPNQ